MMNAGVAASFSRRATLWASGVGSTMATRTFLTSTLMAKPNSTTSTIGSRMRTARVRLSRRMW